MRPRLFTWNIRQLFAVITAIAVLLAPVSIAEAAGAVTGGASIMHQMTGCHMPASPSTQRDQSGSKLCCASIGIAVASDAARPDSRCLVRRSHAAPGVATFRLGYLGEIATPPPRSA